MHHAAVLAWFKHMCAMLMKVAGLPCRSASAGPQARPGGPRPSISRSSVSRGSMSRGSMTGSTLRPGGNGGAAGPRSGPASLAGSPAKLSLSTSRMSGTSAGSAQYAFLHPERLYYSLNETVIPKSDI